MKISRSAAAVQKIADTYRNDPDKQIRELRRLVREGQRAGDLSLVGAAYCTLAEAYYAADDRDNFFSCAFKAVAFLKGTCEYELLANAYSCLAETYTFQGDHQTSLVNDELAYAIVKKHRIRGKTRIRVLNNLSASYHMMGEVRKSIRILNECVDFMKNNYGDEYSDIAMYSLNLAECYKDNGQPDVAKDLLKSMAEWIGKVDFRPIECDYYLRCALLAYSFGDTAEGGGFVDKAFGIMPDNVYPLPMYDDLNKTARYLSKNEDRPRAEKILSLMKVYAEKNKGTLEQMIAVSMIADFYRRFGQCELSAEYYAQYEELNERYMRELREAQLNLLDTVRNTETEVRRLTKKMRISEELASLEPMTKLLNRAALLRVSAEFIETAAKRKQKVGAIFIDIDYFKEYNDTYGHAEGDRIIREVADACRRQDAANIRFARYGGDEFFGITRGLSDEEVRETARRISRIIQSAGIPHEKNVCGGRVTLSVGIVNIPITDSTATVLEIAKYADKAVYYAKNAGKNAIYEIVRGADDGGSSFVKIGF